MATPTGFLSQYGMNVSEQDLRKKDLLERQAKGFAMAQVMGFDDPALMGSYLGARNFGDHLANRKWKPSDDEQKRIQAQTMAQGAFEDWQHKNPKASDEDRAVAFRRAMAESSFKNGLYDVGSQMMLDIEKEEEARAARKLELEGLGIDTRVARETAGDVITGSKQKVRQAGQELGKGTPIYVPGSDDPNSSVGNAFFDEETGVAWVGGKPYQPGEYTTERPDAPRPVGGGGGSDGVGVYEEREVRESYVNTMNIMRSTDNVMNLMDESFKDGGTIEELGAAGNLMAGSARLIDNVSSAFRTVNQMTGRQDKLDGEGLVRGADGQDVNYATAKAKVLKEEGAALDKWLERTGVHKSAATQARYRSQMVDLAYSYALSMSGGGRISDADLKHAMDIVGANLTQPSALKALMSQNMSKAVEAVRYRGRVLGQGKLDKIVQPGAQQEFEAFFNKLDQRIKSPGSPTAGGSPPLVKTEEEFNALPKGTKFIGPDGKTRVKP